MSGFEGMGETRSAKQKWGPNVTEQFRIDMEKQLKALREDRIEEIRFPPDLSNDQRRFVHRLCEKLGLHSKSRGKGEKRFLTVAKKKSIIALRINLKVNSQRLNSNVQHIRCLR